MPKKTVTRPKVRAARSKAMRSPEKTPPVTPPALVPFSFQQVAYQIDVEKSKVYRKFIEIEKSKQFYIINAYRSGARASL